MAFWVLQVSAPRLGVRAPERRPGRPSPTLAPGICVPGELLPRLSELVPLLGEDYSPSHLPTPPGLLQVTRRFDGFQGLDIAKLG